VRIALFSVSGIRRSRTPPKPGKGSSTQGYGFQGLT